MNDSALRFVTWVTLMGGAMAQEIHRDLPYAEAPHARQILDVYSPPGAKQLPVVFWIHGGGWQTGDKTNVEHKPVAFVERGYVFVSTNYRLLPEVAMESIIQDVAKSFRWVHEHIADYGGDPDRIFVMGHSAGAQLAALLCTDAKYLSAEGLTFGPIRGCVPVDGDTYDIPAMIETAETRRRVHHQPQAKFGHREKFGHTAQKHQDFSAVTHISARKGIPPFLILYVAEHPDTTAQAQRLKTVLAAAEIPATLYGGRNTTHTRLNDELGLPDDVASQTLFQFMEDALKSSDRSARSSN